MNTFMIIVMIITILILISMYYVSNKKKPSIMDFTFEHTQYISIGKDHKDLLGEVQNFRIANGKDVLILDDYMIMLARSRNRYLIDNNITEKLHKNFLKHRQSYMNMGLDLISENVSYDDADVFEKWITEVAPNDNMLYDDWLYVGISIEENHLGKKYVSLILAKL